MSLATAPINIHEQLAKLWETEGKDKTLARLFNFILITQKSERTPYYKELIKKVITKFPSRIILLIEDSSSSEDYLTSEVTSETVSEAIYCELIQIEAGGKYREQLPFLILPYIVPDLPIYLLWAKHLLEKTDLLTFMEPFSTRIIFDSDAVVDLNQYTKTILNFLNQFRCEIDDFNWTALSGWREIFFKIFDSNTFTHLDHITKLQITYNRYPTPHFKHNEIKGIYLQGWLAAQLNWKFQNITNDGNGKILLNYKKEDGTPLSVALIPAKEEHLPPGTLLSVELESSYQKGRFVFKRHPESRQVFVQFSDSGHCALPLCIALSGFDPGKEVVGEIFYGNMSTHYKNMLTQLAQIPWPK